MLFLPVLKLKNRFLSLRKITPAVIYPVAIILVGLFSSFNLKKHPTYISLVDIKYKQGSLQISTRMFTNDLEDVLKKTSKKGIDILNPKNKAEADSVLFNYIKQRLHISISAKNQQLHYIGYEKEDESIWSYLEIMKVITVPKKMTVDTKLLYDFLPNETNIVQIEINSLKKSSKVTNPESKINFLF
jgi:hypothetical protein